MSKASPQASKIGSPLFILCKQNTVCYVINLQCTVLTGQALTNLTTNLIRHNISEYQMRTGHVRVNSSL